MSDEERELKLVTNVEWKFLLLTSDENMEKFLAPYLPALILKCDSTFASVRKKTQDVLDLLWEQSKKTGISMPSIELVRLIKAHKKLSITSQCLKFIRVENIKDEDVDEAIEILVSDLSYLDETEIVASFILFVNLLTRRKVTSSTSETEEVHSQEYFQDLELMFVLFLYYIFPGYYGAVATHAGPLFQHVNVLSGIADDNSAAMKLLDGLVKYVIEKWPFNVSRRFLFLVSVNNKSNVSSLAQAEFKRRAIDYEDQELIETMVYSLLFPVHLPSSRLSFEIPDASYILYSECVNVLLKSKSAARDLPKILGVVAMVDQQQISMPPFEKRGKAATVHLTIWIAQNCFEGQLYLNTLGEEVLILLEGIHDTENIVSESTIFLCYDCSALVVEKMGKPSMFRLFLQDLTEWAFKYPSRKTHIKKTILRLCKAFVKAAQNQGTDSVLEKVRAELVEWVFAVLAETNSNYDIFLLMLNILAPFDCIKARLFCIRFNDPLMPLETQAEAETGLSLPRLYQQYYNENTPIVFPGFDDFMDSLIAHRGVLAEEDLDDASTPVIFDALVKFARQSLFAQAINVMTLELVNDNFWSNIHSEVIENDTYRKQISTFLSKDQPETRIKALKSYVELLKMMLTKNTIPHLCVECLYELAAFNCLWIFDNSIQLEGLIFHDNASIRTAAGQLFGLTYRDEIESEILLKKCHAYVIGYKHEIQKYIHGSLYVLAYTLNSENKFGAFTENQHHELSNVVVDLAKVNTPPTLLEVALSAICGFCRGRFWRHESDISDLKLLLKNLILLSQNGSSTAILALGHLSMVESLNYELQLDIFEALHKLHESKSVEVLSSIGVALSCVAGGRASGYLKRFVPSLNGADDDADPRRLTSITDKVLQDAASTKPSLRKATCTWLFSLVKYCGSLSAMKLYLKRFHVVFLGYLGDNDDYIQSTATEGLQLVYEQGDAALQRDLAHSFVMTLTSDRNGASNVGEDTQLFEPGTMNIQGSGSVSTYKDICNLATEVGDQSLVYRFMSLASNARLWSTRRGMASGLGKMASQPSMAKFFDDNPAVLRKLVPALFRFRFDIAGKPMEEIWRSIFPNPKAVISDNFTLILDDLLKHSVDKQWRARQASLYALDELLGGSQKEKYFDQLEDIWKVAFRGLDDVKESVRTAAMGFCKSLVGILLSRLEYNSSVESLSSDQATQSNESIELIISFLLGIHGVQSEAIEIQQFALATILRICGLSKWSIQIYIPRLVGVLIELLTTLEPAALNYLQLNSSASQVSGEMIDNVRLASLQASPVMTAIERCINRTDNTTMPGLMNLLLEYVDKSIGVPSKVALAKVLVNLVVQRQSELAPYAPLFLKSCLSQTLNRNNTVAKSYATTLGFFCKIADLKDVKWCLETLINQSINATDDQSYDRIAYAFQSISRHASDSFTSLGAVILPFVFLMKHYSKSSVSDYYRHIWEENTAGSGALKLYKTETLNLVCRNGLAHSNFDLRQAAACSVSEMVGILKDDEEILVRELLPTLMVALEGRIWNGKEFVLTAAVDTTIASKSHFMVNLKALKEISVVFLREAKRQNKAYRLLCVEQLGKFAATFSEYLELFSPIWDICSPLIAEKDYGSDVEMETGSLRQHLKRHHAIALTTLVNAWYPTTGEDMLKVVDRIVACKTLANAYTEYVTVCSAVETMVVKLAQLEDVGRYEEGITRLWKDVIVELLGNSNFESLRLAGYKDIVAPLDKLRGRLSEALDADIQEDLRALVAKERSTIVLAVARTSH